MSDKREVLKQIDELVRQAKELIQQAEVLSEENGVGFSSDIGIGGEYIPESEIDSFDREHHGAPEQGGYWLASSQIC